MIKVGWGTKIALLYIGFVALMVTMVVLCLNQKIDLVSEDYYQKELVFQNRIDETENADALDGEITYTISNQYMELQFPNEFKGEEVTGEILFFRPSDASKDYKIDIQLNDQVQQLISIDNLSKGMYKMKINWKTNDSKYFNEKTIIIP